MKLMKHPFCTRAWRALAILAGLAGATTLSAIDLTEEFDTALDPLVWQATGDKPGVVSGGRISWGPVGGDWASGDISTVQRFYLPPAGQTTVIRWTLAPGSITTGTGNAIRTQVGIHSANETATRREHWPNTKGGLWLDLDTMSAADPTVAAGGYYFANDTKVANSQATWLAGESSAWNWLADTRIYRLELTDTGYSWFDETDNPTVPAAVHTWAAAGIDTEFQNGFRVLALGMNFAAGRGSNAVERIAITNAFGSTSLISLFGATRATPFSGQLLNLTWSVDPAATVSLDQGIGDVTGSTIAGAGSFQITAPDVVTPTPVTYTLTAMKGAETTTRTFVLNVQPPPTLSLDDFSDHFDSPDLDLSKWEYRGDKSRSIVESRLVWGSDGTNWSHGEVDSVNVFPVPPPGRVTTIKWLLSKADVTIAGPGGNSLRPVVGICSAFETEGWTRQHWQNTTGGVWFDITSMGDNNLTGVSGGIFASNDTKVALSNASNVANFTITDWNWETDNKEITMEITNVGFAMMNGSQTLGAGTWAAYGIDNEFSKGFRILAVGANWDTGRGMMSLDAVSLANSVPLPFEISDLVFDPAGQLATVTFKSTPGILYSLDRSTNLTSWVSVDEVTATGATTQLNHVTATGPKAFYRVRNTQLRPNP